MLIRLLRTHLSKYRRVLVAVVALQFVQTAAALYLPTLNADIIDKGVVTGDNAYIWRTGALMLVVTLIQMGFAIGAVLSGQAHHHEEQQAEEGDVEGAGHPLGDEVPGRGPGIPVMGPGIGDGILGDHGLAHVRPSTQTGSR